MAAGDKTYTGLGVPLWGESTITQTTLGTDILTIEGMASQTGDFFICRDSGQTEKFIVTKDGNVTAAGTVTATGALTASGGITMAAGQYIGFTMPTSAPTTAITKGDIFSMETSTYVQLAIGQTANTLRYVNTTSA